LSRKIVVVNASGERSFDDSDWPLTIGCLPGADIRVAGAVADGDIGLIDVLDERPFLQRIGTARGLTFNGEPVTSTRWLDNGDVIAAQGTTVTCAFGDDEMRFVIAAQAIDYPTLPPEIVAAGDGPGDDDIQIAPIRTRQSSVQAKSTADANPRANWIGVGALVILLTTAVYLFTSKAVLIEIEPPDADVRIAGGLLKPKFGDRYLLRQGSYRVIATAEGYVASREEIIVTDAENQSFDIELEKLPGRLVIETQPAVAARVSIDGSMLGSTTDGPLTVAPGPHTILLETDRYLDYSGSVEIEGRDQLQTLRAELSPGWADVTFTTQPAGATILVDGAEVASTPAAVGIMAGTHDVTLQKDGYKSWQRSLTTVAGGEHEPFDIRLDEADGILRVATRPAGAAVSIDGRYRGQTPIEVDLSPGTSVEVIVTKPGFASIKRTVRVESRQNQALRFNLEARTGEVRIFLISRRGPVRYGSRVRPATRNSSSTVAPSAVPGRR